MYAMPGNLVHAYLRSSCGERERTVPIRKRRRLYRVVCLTSAQTIGGGPVQIHRNSIVVVADGSYIFGTGGSYQFCRCNDDVGGTRSLWVTLHTREDPGQNYVTVYVVLFAQ